MSNAKARYFSLIGSYEGVIKVRVGLNQRWVHVTDMNRIDKTGWVRWQGPASKRISEVLREPSVKACTLVTNLNKPDHSIKQDPIYRNAREQMEMALTYLCHARSFARATKRTDVEGELNQAIEHTEHAIAKGE